MFLRMCIRKYASGRKIGCIANGYCADMIVFETDHPQFCGRSADELIHSWIFSGNTNAVRDVYVDGIQLVQDHMHCSEEEVGVRFRESITDLLS